MTWLCRSIVTLMLLCGVCRADMCVEGTISHVPTPEESSDITDAINAIIIFDMDVGSLLSSMQAAGNIGILEPGQLTDSGAGILGTHDRDTVLVDPFCSTAQLVARLWHEGRHVINANSADVLYDPFTDSEFTSNATCNHVALYAEGSWVACELCCTAMTCDCWELGEASGDLAWRKKFCPSNDVPVPDPVDDCCCQ